MKKTFFVLLSLLVVLIILGLYGGLVQYSNVGIQQEARTGGASPVTSITIATTSVMLTLWRGATTTASEPIILPPILQTLVTEEELKSLSFFELFKNIEGEVYGVFGVEVSRQLLERLDDAMGTGVVKAHILIPAGCYIGDLETFKKLEVEYYENRIVPGDEQFSFWFFVDDYRTGDQYEIVGGMSGPDTVTYYMIQKDLTKEAFLRLFEYAKGEGGMADISSVKGEIVYLEADIGQTPSGRIQPCLEVDFEIKPKKIPYKVKVIMIKVEDGSKQIAELLPDRDYVCLPLCDPGETPDPGKYRVELWIMDKKLAEKEINLSNYKLEIRFYEIKVSEEVGGFVTFYVEVEIENYGDIPTVIKGFNVTLDGRLAPQLAAQFLGQNLFRPIRVPKRGGGGATIEATLSFPNVAPGEHLLKVIFWTDKGDTLELEQKIITKGEPCVTTITKWYQ